MSQKRQTNYKDGKSNPLIVVLSACGNPDILQPENLGIPIKKEQVFTLIEASEVCQEYIREYELGGGNWLGGKVFDAITNEQVAYVSYNGKVWTQLEKWMKD